MSEADEAEPGIEEPTPANKPARVTPSAERARTASPFFNRILGALAGPSRLSATTRDAQRVVAMCHALLSERGEISGTRLATEVLAAYQELDAPARDAFFGLLSNGFVPDAQHVAEAMDAYRTLPSPATLVQLQAAVESPRQELFRRLNLAHGGTGVLIEMRRQLLSTLEKHPDRGGVDADLAHLFRSWFNGGFLVLQRIDWRTSALVLERLIQFEAVHQIQGWDDLRRRLEVDRRCYAFFHPSLPHEPLIFIEVALTQGMSAKVQPLLDPQSLVADPTVANCAIFYSITNCQEGLRGVSFGNLLIKQVVEDLKRSFPRLRTFVTLSPIPGFRKWLVTTLEASAGSHVSAELLAMRGSFNGSLLPADTIAAPLRDEFLRLCAYYLLHAKQGKAPLDPVARFHLANGARLERLNWMGDTSEFGLRRSLGLMANYVYCLADLERNHQAYEEHRIVASRQVERLAKHSPLTSLSAAPPLKRVPAQVPARFAAGDRTELPKSG